MAEGDELRIDAAAAAGVGLDQASLAELLGRERREVERNIACFRGGRPLPALGGRDVIVVDDGLATGLTAEAALGVVRRHAPHTVTLAVPVGAPDSLARLGRLADDVVCLHRPTPFLAVGLWYEEFGQTSDDEVVRLLAEGRRQPGDRFS
ncbi:MAG: hypothetical protein M3Z46_13825 [Actinomycetota bacterium]|nr:hypothetical protein [Actinomycetota bacterium]